MGKRLRRTKQVNLRVYANTLQSPVLRINKFVLRSVWSVSWSCICFPDTRLCFRRLWHPIGITWPDILNSYSCEICSSIRSPVKPPLTEVKICWKQVGRYNFSSICPPGHATGSESSAASDPAPCWDLSPRDIRQGESVETNARLKSLKMQMISIYVLIYKPFIVQTKDDLPIIINLSQWNTAGLLWDHIKNPDVSIQNRDVPQHSWLENDIVTSYS